MWATPQLTEFAIATHHPEPDLVVLELSGGVKLGPACHALEWRIRGLLRTHPKRIILDLSAVDSMDSAGLGTLVNCYWSALQAGGAVRLAGVHGRVEQVIRRAALDTVLPCFPAVEDACRDFHAGAPSRI